MNGEIYMKWLKNRLIPTFKAMFPNKKMILVLDNASYHHVRGDDWITPSAMPKLALGCLLRELGITEMWVDRKQKNGTVIKKRVGQNSYFETGSYWAPRVDEMRARLKQYLVEHPEYQKTEVQKLFDKDGYQLIYTPPYTPTTQPIEKVWGYVKNYVAKQFTNGRNMETLRNQTIDGMYGNTEHNHEGVTSDYCNKVIQHAHDWCNSYISTAGRFGGTVEQLLDNPAIDRIVPSIEDDEAEEADAFGGEAVESDIEDD
jgi:hypothetical protein